MPLRRALFVSLLAKESLSSMPFQCGARWPHRGVGWHSEWLAMELVVGSAVLEAFLQPSAYNESVLLTDGNTRSNSRCTSDRTESPLETACSPPWTYALMWAASRLEALLI
jgi:hypothetical protein